MADYKVTDTELTSIANAIRTKGGTSASLEFPTGFVSAVNAIPSGGSGGSSYNTQSWSLGVFLAVTTFVPDSVSFNVTASEEV